MQMYPVRGRAHTPEQKQHLMDRLSVVWNSVPELRLSQFILCATHGKDIFYLEDEEIIEMMESFAQRNQQEWQQEPVDDYYTLQEVMELFGKSRSTILRSAKSGYIPSVLPDGMKKGRRYPKEAIDALVERQKGAPRRKSRVVMSPYFYTLEEVCSLLYKSRSAVMREVKKGKIPFLLPEGKKKGRIYPKPEIDLMVKRMEITNANLL